MQRSESNPPVKQDAGKIDDRDFAVLVESLYVANLLILPVLAFIILALLFIKRHGSLTALADAHLEQTMSASIWTGVIFLIAALTVMLMKLMGVEDVTIWVIAIITFTIIHATMVLLGIIGLAKALAGKCWRYPLIGKPLPANCPQ
jgi:uncharacterized Tic20 family protein